MSDVVIQVLNLSKRYRLGVIGTGTLAHDINRWWARIRGKDDPLAKVTSTQKVGHTREPRIGRMKRIDNGATTANALLTSDTNSPNSQNSRLDDYMWALNDVSFEVKRGEVLGIIGGNGAGKSTLLKILSRVTAPTSGEVNVRGRIASLLEVGTGFHPELTGRENIFLNGAILGMSKRDIRSRFSAIVEFSEVSKYIDTPVKRYSSGMYVRLAFAVAAHLEPEILVVDEVLAVGDVGFQRKCLGKMHDISEQGRTVLFVSHNMAAIKALCHRAILLNQGEIEADADAESVVHGYLQAGTPPSSASLEDRTDRKGNGAIRFIHIELMDAVGAPVQAWISGQRGRIRLRYKSVTASGSERLHIAVGLNDEMGTRIVLYDNEICGSELFVSLEGVGIVDVIVPKVCCVPGRYLLTLYSKVNGSEADWVTNAFALDVQEGNFFGTGKPISPGESQVLMEHSFTPVGGQESA